MWLPALGGRVVAPTPPPWVRSARALQVCSPGPVDSPVCFLASPLRVRADPVPLPWFPWGPPADGVSASRPWPPLLELGTAPQETAPGPLPAEGAGPGLWELGSRLGRAGQMVGPGGPGCPAVVLAWGVLVRRFGGEQREGESSALQTGVGRGLRALSCRFVPCPLAFSLGPRRPGVALGPLLSTV